MSIKREPGSRFTLRLDNLTWAGIAAMRAALAERTDQPARDLLAKLDHDIAEAGMLPKPNLWAARAHRRAEYARTQPMPKRTPDPG